MKKIILTLPFSLFCLSGLAQWSGTTDEYTMNKVGIGTSTPSEKLSIRSSWGITGSGSNCSYTGIPALRINWIEPSQMPNCSNYTNTIPNIMEVYNSNSPLMVLSSTGKLGIGNNTPLSKLYVSGDLQVNYGMDGDLVKFFNSRSQSHPENTLLTLGYSVNQSNNPYLFKAIGKQNNSDYNVMVIMNDKAVGINYDDAEVSLTVGGGLLVDASSEFTGTLSQNIKVPLLKFGNSTSGEGIGSTRSGTSNLWGLDFFTNYSKRMSITNNGAVTIGNVNTPAGYKLYVEGGILTEQVKVAIKTTNDWSDYVFAPNYKLKPLSEVELFIKTNKHLPDVPSATDVVNGGVNLGKMDATLLQKIEELTLYTIELQKQVTSLQEKVITLEKEK